MRFVRFIPVLWLAGCQLMNEQQRNPAAENTSVQVFSASYSTDPSNQSLPRPKGVSKQIIACKGCVGYMLAPNTFSAACRS